MRLALPHAVEVQSRFDREMSALELARRSAVERLATNARSRLRRRLGRGPGGRLTLRCLGLRGRFRQIDLASRRALVERPRALRHALPKLNVAVAILPALAHALA